MTYSNYKKRLIRITKKNNLLKRNIQSRPLQCLDEPLIITGAQSIKKEESLFKNLDELCENEEPVESITSVDKKPQTLPVTRSNIFDQINANCLIEKVKSESENKSILEQLLRKVTDLSDEIRSLRHEVRELRETVPNNTTRSIEPRTMLAIESRPDYTDEDRNENLPPLQADPAITELVLELPVDIPVSNEADLEQLVDWIREDRNKHSLALALISGGPFVDVPDRVRATLRRLMTTRMAALFNWEGRNRANGPKKSSFLKTGLWVSVLMAADQEDGLDEMQAQMVAKQWFKQANGNLKPKR